MKEVEAVKTKEDIAHVERLLRRHKSDLYGDLWRIGGKRENILQVLAANAERETLGPPQVPSTVPSPPTQEDTGKSYAESG